MQIKERESLIVEVGQIKVGSKFIMSDGISVQKLWKILCTLN